MLSGASVLPWLTFTGANGHNAPPLWPICWVHMYASTVWGHRRVESEEPTTTRYETCSRFISLSTTEVPNVWTTLQQGRHSPLLDTVHDLHQRLPLTKPAHYGPISCCPPFPRRHNQLPADRLWQVKKWIVRLLLTFKTVFIGCLSQKYDWQLVN